MKKIILIATGALIAVLALGVAGLAYAQTQTPPEPAYPAGPGWMHWGAEGAPQTGTYGPGMMGGRGFGRMGGHMTGTAGYGPMHTYMLSALAAELGLTEEDLQARLDAGATMWQIALDQGLTEEQVVELMDRAHDAALEAAVAAGALTQEQADWMEEHMDAMQATGFGAGGCHGRGGGFGRGWQQAPANPEN